jgi:LDH2 family malate/lactate/ureidoglycolate dehydrogenase
MKSYQINELRELIYRILLSQGYRDEDAMISTEVLLYAEIRGNNQGHLDSSHHGKYELRNS